jgi:hypothetical protein
MNSKLACVMAAAVATGTAHTALAVILTGPIVNPENGHSYYLLTPATWTTSETEAQSLGGTLAIIRNQSEQDWVFDTFGTFQGTNYSLWIGLYDPTQDQSGGSHVSNFVWVDGESSTYRNWGGGEPNDSNSSEFYVHMSKTNNGFGTVPGGWNDMDNVGLFAQFAPFAGVVEVAPEPSSLALLGLCGSTLFCRRRQRAPRTAVI